MTVNDRPERVLRELALRNGGIFTEQHARSAGLSAKQTRARRKDGSFIEVYPGVMHFGGIVAARELQLRAALEFAGPDAWLARRTAAERSGLDVAVEATPEVLVPYERHPSASNLVVLRSKLMPATDRTYKDGLSMTNVNRTIADLAAVLDEEQLETAIESARRQGLTSIAALSARLSSLRGPGRTGATRLERVLDSLDDRAPSESALEVKVARVLRAAGLTPTPQYRIKLNGNWYRVDFAWPEIKLILECDGRAYHQDFDADRARWSALGGSGWRIIYVTWREITRDPDGVAARVAGNVRSLTESVPLRSASGQ